MSPPIYYRTTVCQCDQVILIQKDFEEVISDFDEYSYFFYFSKCNNLTITNLSFKAALSKGHS